MKETRQYKMNMPAEIDAWASAQAEKNCRSKSAQIIFVLRSVMAAGGDLGGTAPAAETTQKDGQEAA